MTIEEKAQGYANSNLGFYDELTGLSDAFISGYNLAKSEILEQLIDLLDYEKSYSKNDIISIINSNLVNPPSHKQ